jgi:erythronate-4-phosphate dehydrogenase
MKIVCASSLTLGREIFSTIGDVLIVPEKDINAATIKDADLLATRSKAKVNAAMLDGTNVKFYGTATAGTDHMDIAYLDRRGLPWTAAPGCNANSVSEYVTAALLRESVLHGGELAGKKIVVIGVGQVGSRVAKKAEALGMIPLLNDPPVKKKTGDQRFNELSEILPHADVVTLHVPLTENCEFATAKMAGEKFFAALKPGCFFINASRGEVVDEDALLRALDRGVIRRMVLDVFDNEPDIRLDVMNRADISTPHIAGHSYEGKLNGTVMVYQAACHYFGIAPRWTSDSSAKLIDIELDATGLRGEEAMLRAVSRAYDIEKDNRELRSGAAAIGKKFNAMRGNYPDRFEFPRHCIRLRGASPQLTAKLRGLGFQTS